MAEKISRTRMGRQAQGRLVEEHDARPRHEPAGHGQHLLLATREGGRGQIELCREGREEGERGVQVGAHRCGIATARAGERTQHEVVAHALVAEDAAPFGHEGDAVSGHPPRGPSADLTAIEGDAPGGGAKHPGDGLEQRRLARAVSADHGDDLARPHIDGDVVEHGHRAVPDAESQTR